MVNFELCNEISQELCILSCLDDWEMKELSEMQNQRPSDLITCSHACSQALTKKLFDDQGHSFYKLTLSF